MERSELRRADPLDAFLHAQQNKVGTLPKDKMAGKFVTEWATALTGSGKDIKEVDVGVGVSALLAVKDAEEQVSRLIWSSVRTSTSLGGYSSEHFTCAELC